MCNYYKASYNVGNGDYFYLQCKGVPAGISVLAKSDDFKNGDMLSLRMFDSTNFINFITGNSYVCYCSYLCFPQSNNIDPKVGSCITTSVGDIFFVISSGNSWYSSTIALTTVIQKMNSAKYPNCGKTEYSALSTGANVWYQCAGVPANVVTFAEMNNYRLGAYLSFQMLDTVNFLKWRETGSMTSSSCVCDQLCYAATSAPDPKAGICTQKVAGDVFFVIIDSYSSGKTDISVTTDYAVDSNHSFPTVKILTSAYQRDSAANIITASDMNGANQISSECTLLIISLIMFVMV